jgi:hypothetical protein
MVIRNYIHAGLAAVIAVVAAIAAAAAVAIFNDPGVRTVAAQKLGCPAVNQLIKKYAADTGNSFDAVKCISVTATDPTHWAAVVSVTLAGVTRQWNITFSGDGVQITGATPVPPA